MGTDSVTVVPGLAIATTRSPFGFQNRVDGEALEAIPFDDVIALDSFPRHPQLLHDASRRRVAQEMPGFDAVKTEGLEAEVDEALAGLRRIASIPAIDSDPVPELGAPMFALNEEADDTDQGTSPGADHSKGYAGAIDPRRAVLSDPFFGTAMRIRMRNVEGRVGDLTKPCQPLDIEGVVSDEWSEYQSLGGQSRLVMDDARFEFRLHAGARKELFVIHRESRRETGEPPARGREGFPLLYISRQR